MLDFSKLFKKPVTKEVDDVNNCHFRKLYTRDAQEDCEDTDPNILASLQLNTNLNYYTLSEAIAATTRVSLHLCICILYFIVYFHLAHENVTPTHVFQVSFGCTIVGYIVVQMWRFWKESWNRETLMKIPLVSDCFVGICCASFSYLFTPILRTITNSMDSDSVYAVCIIMFGIHLITNNYGINSFCVSRSLSMNSAIFSMICLASRLQSDMHCLALVSFGVLSFICFPQFSQMLWTWTPGSVILCAIGACASYTVSTGLALFFACIMFVVVVISPTFYIMCVQYKENKLGPWDEAKPDLTVDMEEIQKGFQERSSLLRDAMKGSGKKETFKND